MCVPLMQECEECSGLNGCICTVVAVEGSHIANFCRINGSTLVNSLLI